MNRKVVNDSLRPKLTIKDATNANRFDKYSEFSYVDVMQNCWKQKLEDRISLDELISMINSFLRRKSSISVVDASTENIETMV